MCAGSAFAAATANQHVYWTRGFDGTGIFEATTTNSIFSEAGGSIFSDRLINGANTIANLDDLNVLDKTSGVRTDDSSTASYTADGSLYLHVGYINSGYTGTGITVDPIDLNGNLVIGRMGVENTYVRDSATSATPNLPTIITAGNTNNGITFKYAGTANEMMFFRSNTAPATMQFDCNLDFDLTGSKLSGSKVFSISKGNTLIFGSKEHARTLTVGTGVGYSQNFVNAEFGATVTNYSNLNISGNTFSYIFRGCADYNLVGDMTINLPNYISGTSNYFSLLTMSGGTATEKVSAIVDGNLTISSMANYAYADIYYVNKTNDYLEINGTADINSTVLTGLFSYVTLNNTNQSALIKGKTTVNLASSLKFQLFRMQAANETITVDGDIVIKGAGTNKDDTAYYTQLFVYNNAVSGQNAVVNGNISFESNTKFTTLYSFNGVGANTLTINGNITITSNTFSEQILGARINSGSVVNFMGKIDTTARTDQTSFGGGSLDGIVNFKGKVDNTFTNIGLRGCVYNLLNTNGSAAISTNKYLALGGSAHLNIFGANQLKVLDNTIWSLWGAYSATKVSGIVNLNGTSLTMGTFNPAGSSRYAIIDFGMSDSGMTTAQLAAQGITAGMIHETGAGIAQTFTLGKIDYHSAATVADCYLLFKNFVVGEDEILSYVKLSDITVGESSCYSKTNILENVIRIDGYTDSEKYGIEYYLAEIEGTDGDGNKYWSYTIVAIPEASAYAAVFGVLALAFCVSRRSKKN